MLSKTQARNERIVTHVIALIYTGIPVGLMSILDAPGWAIVGIGWIIFDQAREYLVKG